MRRCAGEAAGRTPAIIGPCPPAAPPSWWRASRRHFRRPHEQMHTLKERALHPFRARARSTAFDAVRDVSFAVEQGEFFGIVGRNGSGKSTLLKLIAGIYQRQRRRDLGQRPDVDVHRARRRLQPRPRRARQRDPQRRSCSASRPAEARDALRAGDRLRRAARVRGRSSSRTTRRACTSRLAFSVMIQVDADVLLIDEVLAVGDAAFQQKCFDEFNRLRDEGKHDRARHPRHGRRAALLPPGDADGARRGRSRSATPSASARSTSSSTSTTIRESAPSDVDREDEPDRYGDGTRAVHRAVDRGRRTASRSTRRRRARRSSSRRWSSSATRLERPDRRALDRERGPPARVRDAARSGSRSAPGRFARRRPRDADACACRTCSRPAATTSRRTSRARGTGPRAAGPPPAHASRSSSTGTRDDRRHRRPRARPALRAHARPPREARDARERRPSRRSAPPAARGSPGPAR